MRRFTRTFLVLFTLVLVALTVVASQSAQAQTFKVLHTFTGGADGGYPYAGLTMNRAGNLYGTAGGGGNTGGNCGNAGCGTVFKLAHVGSGWVFTPIYSFTGGNDGSTPEAGVVFGPDGSLYGTTGYGGQYGNGIVFNLKPSPTACKAALCPWTETVLYSFPAGDSPLPLGDVVFDQVGNLYGSTLRGGSGCVYGCGTVYKLTSSRGAWTLSAVYDFQGTTDGAGPYGVTLDNAGNLYGAADDGGAYNEGTVFQLTTSGSGFIENTLHAFKYSEGIFPESGLILDGSGNLYGSTTGGGDSSGTIFEMTPSDNGWSYMVLYKFALKYGAPLDAPLAIDTAGNLFGTVNRGSNGGAIFKLSPGSGGWTFTSLYEFSGGSDGGGPLGNVAFDASANLYGTTEYGGTKGGVCDPNGCGVVWEITP